MSAYWPPGLPDPQFGNAGTTAENRLQSDSDIAPRQRVVDPNYRQTLSVSWTMTERQFRAFESWYEYRLHDGISWFGIRWLGGEGRAHFTGNLSASLNGALWQLSGEVEMDHALSR